MAGLGSALLMGLAGGVKGYGEHAVRVGLQKREMKMKLLDQQFTASENQKNREYQRETEMMAAGRKPPTVKEFFDDDSGQPYKAQWNPQTKEWDRIGGWKAASGGITITNPDGTTTQIGGPANKLTVDQGKNTGFLIRARDANAVLDNLDTEGTKFWSRTAEDLPLGVGNYLQSDEYQKFEQARRDFINAVLRRESGAVISDAEFENADKQYFPQPGDSDEVIKQKRRNRANAVKGFEVGAGPGVAHPAAKPDESDAGNGGTEIEVDGVKYRVRRRK